MLERKDHGREFTSEEHRKGVRAEGWMKEETRKEGGKKGEGKEGRERERREERRKREDDVTPNFSRLEALQLHIWDAAAARCFASCK